MRALIVPLVAVGALLALGGCSLSMPTDPNGTLDRVSGSELRVGATPNGELVTIDGDGTPTGTEVAVVEDFAESIDAEITWTVSSEEALVRGLEDGRLDLVIGGLTDETPWMERAGTTRPYVEVTSANGTSHRLVMLVPTGENAFLSELETFLSQPGRAPKTDEGAIE